MATREQVDLALLAVLQAVPGLVTVGRVLRHWTDCAPSEQPAAYLSKTGEMLTPANPKGGPAKLLLHYEIILYTYSADPGVAPATAMNAALDYLSAAFSPFSLSSIAGQPQTLGGLVRWAVITGKIETDEGKLGPQSVAIVPLEVCLL